jgi:IstB-like ATP binding protein
VSPSQLGQFGPLATALGIASTEAGYRTYFVSGADLVANLQSAHLEGTAADKMRPRERLECAAIGQKWLHRVAWGCGIWGPAPNRWPRQRSRPLMTARSTGVGFGESRSSDPMDLSGGWAMNRGVRPR